MTHPHTTSICCYRVPFPPFPILTLLLHFPWMSAASSSKDGAAQRKPDCSFARFKSRILTLYLMASCMQCTLCYLPLHPGNG